MAQNKGKRNEQEPAEAAKEAVMMPEHQRCDTTETEEVDAGASLQSIEIEQAMKMEEGVTVTPLVGQNLQDSAAPVIEEEEEILFEVQNQAEPEEAVDAVEVEEVKEKVSEEAEEMPEVNEVTEDKEKIAEEAEEQAEAPLEYDPETLGTSKQTQIVKDYPMMSPDEKLNVPYIERFNGNLCVQAKEFEQAVAHYNKSLLSLQMLFKMDKDAVVTTNEQAIKLIKEIEVIVCVNLAHCYNQLKNYHYAIKYASQALEKDLGNVKALYRLSVAYTRIGELEKAKENIQTVLDSECDQDMKNSATHVLQEVQQVERRNKSNEKQMLQRMFKPRPASPESPSATALPAEVKEKEVIANDTQNHEKETAEVVVAEQQTLLQKLSAFFCWTILLPYTVPLECTKYGLWMFKTCLLFCYSVLVVISIITAGIAIYIPGIGEPLAQFCLIPSRINSIPEQPLVKYFLEMCNGMSQIPDPEIVDGKGMN